jgi:hypothetical protein
LSNVCWTRTTVGGPNYLGGSVTQRTPPAAPRVRPLWPPAARPSARRPGPPLMARLPAVRPSALPAAASAPGNAAPLLPPRRPRPPRGAAPSPPPVRLPGPLMRGPSAPCARPLPSAAWTPARFLSVSRRSSCARPRLPNAFPRPQPHARGDLFLVFN